MIMVKDPWMAIDKGRGAQRSKSCTGSSTLEKSDETP